MKILYTAEATTVGGRNGTSKTADGSLKFDMAVPKEMGGTGKKGTNPEQLFAMGYSACFGGAIEHLARMQKKSLKEIQVTAKVHFGQEEKNGYAIAVELDVRLPGVPRAEAEALVNEAHNKVCPYSKATRGNIEVKLKVLD